MFTFTYYEAGQGEPKAWGLFGSRASALVHQLDAWHFFGNTDDPMYKIGKIGPDMNVPSDRTSDGDDRVMYLTRIIEPA